MSSLRLFALAAACAACTGAVSLSGCASIDDRPMQQIEVHTVLDHHEVAGVGCVLGNGAGRWFVVAPGRVTVQRSREPLSVDCARAGTGSAVEQAASSSPSMIDGDKLIGDLVIKAGLNEYVRPFDGAAVSYPPTLTVLMRPATAPAEKQGAESGNTLF
jgi:hypothetical protein